MDKNTLTYEYHTETLLLDNKPEEVFVFFSHDNSYSVERVAFNNLYNKTEIIGDDNIIGMGKDVIGLTKFAENYLQELAEETGIDRELRTPTGEWIEFKA